MPSKATNRVLTDHEEIRRWAEERGGEPAHVKRTGDGGEVGVLRLDFPGYSGEGTLEHISWDDFFDKFDESGLALLVQDETAGGERSNFNKLVSRETAQNIDQKRAGRGRARGRAAAGQSRKSVGRTSTAAPKKKAKKATRSAGRTRSARTSAKTSSQKTTARSARSTRAKKSTAAQSSRRANTKSKSKSRASRGTAGKVITMRASKSPSSASRKSNRGQSGRRRAA